MNQNNVEKVLNLLESAWFEDWYATTFVDYIEGVDDAKSKEEILEDLKKKLSY